MSIHASVLLLGLTLSLTILPSCQPLPDPNRDRFGGNRSPVIIEPSVRSDAVELFARNPLEEFQATGANPRPIRILSSGEKLTILQNGVRFTKVRLKDGTIGYLSNNDIIQGSGGSSGRYRIPDQDGNRFGGGSRNLPTPIPTDPQPSDPGIPTNPTTPGDPGIPTNPTTPGDPAIPIDPDNSNPEKIDLDDV